MVPSDMYLLHSNLLLHLNWFYYPELWALVWVCISLGEIMHVSVGDLYDTKPLGFWAEHFTEAMFVVEGFDVIYQEDISFSI
jgi:hypothetical protein